MSKIQMRFAGTGGQGMMLIGDLMAYALGMKEDKEIVLLKSYGPEARGGACRSELIADEEKISYPAITTLTFLLSMSQLSYDSYTDDADDKTVILVDSELVSKTNEKFSYTYKIPLTKLASEKCGKPICANIVALGALCKITRLVSKEKMIEVLKEKLNPKILELNLTAFEVGWEAID